ncbi:hypothetical protein BgAZ_207570 [Babesia gibsoni]|uniref:Uncharacterized protein n=1 Tax=Babesia gibsoni TaxID=33632 RepID=A0AAD8PEI7_BABGI|nr:hypothetical protein BgAZ_207570 [Babesia gibsoni]
MDSSTLSNYNKWIEAWQVVVNNVETNLKAVVIILNKFLLFTGIDADKADNLEARVDILLKSYQKDASNQEPDDVNVENAFELLGDIKGCPQKRLKDVSPLTGNIMANVPGTVAMFLQRQSDKMLQILCEIRAECQTFKTGSLPKMEQVCNTAATHINRRMLSMESAEGDVASLDAVYLAYQEVARDLEAILQLTSVICTYPTHKQQIQSYIQQITDFRLGKMSKYQTSLM